MAKIKGYIEEFLWDARGLGYDVNCLPRLADMENIVQNRITIWEYNDMSEKEYYSNEKVEEVEPLER